MISMEYHDNRKVLFRCIQLCWECAEICSLAM